MPSSLKSETSSSGLLGCDAKTTAQRLQLHRTTLYHRLRKIEAIAGVDLRTGDDRLAMHLDLKLARLAGIWPSPVIAQPAAGPGSSARPAQSAGRIAMILRSSST